MGASAAAHLLSTTGASAAVSSSASVSTGTGVLHGACTSSAGASAGGTGVSKGAAALPGTGVLHGACTMSVTALAFTRAVRFVFSAALVFFETPLRFLLPVLFFAVCLVRAIAAICGCFEK